MKNDFIKYNTFRKSEFALTTIIQSDEQKRIVKKKSLNIQSKSFLESIANNYSLLKTQYQNIKVCPCIMKDENLEIEFEFIEGKSLIDILLKHSKENNKNEFLNILSSLKSIVLDDDRLQVKKAYNVSAEFENIFGKYEGTFPFDYIDISNIDLTFNNVISDDSKNYTIIDYEWVFDFPIPVEYIIYRNSILIKSLFPNEDEFELSGISKTDSQVFDKMEDNFQKFVHGNNGGIYSRYIVDNNKCIVSNLFNSNDYFSIYFYGTGNYSHGYLRKIPIKWKKKIKGFLTGETAKNEKTFEGYKIFSIDEIENQSTIVISTSKEYQDIVYNRIKHLEDKGVKIIRLD